MKDKDKKTKQTRKKSKEISADLPYTIVIASNKIERNKKCVHTKVKGQHH